MIKFFRKIRQKMLTENKISMYLIYAIGEIFLVVIGILIALQINNLNEIRQNRNLEIELLTEVKSSLEKDLKDVINNLGEETERLKSQTKVIDWIENKNIKIDSLGFHFFKISYVTVFNDYESTYKSLQKAGVRIIVNDSLRNQISRLYETEYEQMKIYVVEHLKANDKLNSDNGKYFDEGLNYLGQTKVLDTTGLKADREYLYNLKTMRNFNALMINYFIPKLTSVLI